MSASAGTTEHAEHPAHRGSMVRGSVEEPDGLAQRLFNSIGALFLVVLLSPLLLVVAFAVWRTDGAPILFHQYRVGPGGRLFRCLKFRTMLRNANEVLQHVLATDPMARQEWLSNHKLRNDPRITPIGRLLRRTSLDELPQLFNVLRGEMNLVGPRPIVVQELRKYGPTKHLYLSVKPGMTGLWQVSGRSETTYDERVALDRAYVQGRSLIFDMKILLRTAAVLLKRDGAF